MICEGGVMPDDGCPRPSSRVRVKRFAFRADQPNHLLETVLLHVRQMFRKPLMAVHPIFCSADRPKKNHACSGLWICHGKGSDWPAPHTATKEMCAFDT